MVNCSESGWQRQGDGDRRGGALRRELRGRDPLAGFLENKGLIPWDTIPVGVADRDPNRPDGRCPWERERGTSAGTTCFTTWDRRRRGGDPGAQGLHASAWKRVRVENGGGPKALWRPGPRVRETTTRSLDVDLETLEEENTFVAQPAPRRGRTRKNGQQPEVRWLMCEQRAAGGGLRVPLRAV